MVVQRHVASFARLLLDMQCQVTPVARVVTSARGSLNFLFFFFSFPIFGVGII